MVHMGTSMLKKHQVPPLFKAAKFRAQRVHKKFPKPNRAHHSSEQKPHSRPSPSCTTPSRPPGSGQQPLLDSPRLGPSQTILLAGHQQEFTTRASSTPGLPWSFQRSKSLFCLPTEDPDPASSAVPQCFSNTGAPGHRASEWRHGHLLSIDRLGPSQKILLAGHQQEFTTRASSTPGLPWSFQRSKSLFCLPTEDPDPASSAVPQCFSNTGAPGHRASEWRHGHLLSIDDLEGSQETDVDTGLRLSSSDLSVVSAYSAPSRFFSALETPLPSERCGSHCSKHKGSREGPLPTGSGVTTETSWASLPLFTEGPSSSLATAVAAPPASGAATLTGPSSKLPGDAPNTEQTGRHITPSPALAGPGDSDSEEFYI
ncbi:Protein FAM124A [Myotis brandtii]|uniref:Protein FAM124A n=1 Tax=Myotis brandtii TaxID=109478 RepID=S7PU31_MYOBR|nr:Protein FAM124A [Myotis brandtii]